MLAPPFADATYSNPVHLGEVLPPIIVAVTYLTLYGRRLRTLARERRPVASWRVWCFVLGVVLMTVVQLGPVDDLADSLLVVHMAQHIVIGDIASLFIVLGLTGPVLQPLLHMKATRPLRVMATPLIALILWALNLYMWHIPFFYQAAINHDLVHSLEHACMLWFGALLWLALIGPLPKPQWFQGWGALLYVISVRLLGAVLANVLIWGQTVFYPVYNARDAPRGLNPLSDQNLAGGLMMIEESLLTVVLLAWLFFRFAMRDEQRQELLDLAEEHGVALTDERAARAAAAGETERLRERILSAAGEAHGSEPGGG
ncbi:MAG: cytochrome c oxidase assembly protein [Solirubrobacteraceae bacterium]